MPDALFWSLCSHAQDPRASTRRRDLFLGLLVLAVLQLVVPTSHVRAGPPPPVADARAAASCTSPSACVDAAARAYLRDQDTNASAVQIAVWKDGKFVYSRAFGFADPQHRVPAKPRSLFLIGSNGKKATALAVLRAVDAGRVGLDDRIADVLPDLALAREPEWAGEATVRDLLSHQSGLWDYTPWIDAPADGAMQETLHGVFADNEWATTPPGAAYNYSNANYAVLGAVLERAYARPYAEVMEREVYTPLRLHDTFVRRADAIRTGRAVWGYGLSRTQLSGLDYFDLAGAAAGELSPAWVPPAEEVDNAFLRPAGLSWSTAEDECRLGAFLLQGQPRYLRAATRRELLTPQTELIPGVPEVAYSFGLMIGDGLTLGADEWYDVPLWTHDGGTPTMASLFLVLPEQHFVLSVLRNAPESPESLTTLLATTVRQYAGLPPRRPAPLVVPPDSGARYAGTYADPQAFGTLALRWDGTALTVSAPGLEALGVTVDPTVIVARPNVLVLTVDGEPIELTVWPSASSDAGYLVARQDAFVRIAD